MSGIGPQEGDLEEADAEDEEPSVDAPKNGSHPGAQVINIHGPGGKGKKRTGEPGLSADDRSALEALAKLGGGKKRYWVKRVSCPGWDRPVKIGGLPIELTQEDLNYPSLCEKLGQGVYELGIGKHTITLPLATEDPPREFGTPRPPEPDTTPTWIQTPQGPQLVYLPKGVPPPPPPMSGWGGFGGGWGAPAPQQDMAKTLGDVLKPFLDALSKRDEASKGDIQLQIAREDRAAAEKKAAEDRQAREAEAKARIEEAKAAATTAQHKADLEHAQRIEEIKADRDARVAEAKEKAAAEREDRTAKSKDNNDILDRMLKMRDLFAPEREGNPLNDAVEAFKLLNGLKGKSTIFTEVLEALPPVIKAAGNEVRQIAAMMPAAPQQTGVPAAPPQPAANPQPAAQLRSEDEEKIKELMTAVKTILDAIKAKGDPAAAVNVLRPPYPKGASRVLDWARQTAIGDVMKGFEELAARPGLAESSKALIAEFKAVALTDAGKVWLLEFFQIVKGA